MPLRILALRFDGYTVMRNGGIGAGSRNRRKRDVLQLAGVAPEGFERLRGIDFGKFAGRCMNRKPVQKTGHRDAVAQLRLAGTFEFGRVLARLHQGDRIGPDVGDTPRLLQDRNEFGWRRRGIE